MASPFLTDSQLAVARSFFATGNALRSAQSINLMRQLRAAMPFAPMLLDDDTSLPSRIQIVQTLDNESLAYTAALLGVDPDTFPATITLRPVSVIRDVINALRNYPAAPEAGNAPLPIELEGLTSLHLSDTFPLVRMRIIFDNAMSGRVPFASTLAALEKFNATDVGIPGWVERARTGQQAQLSLGWTVQVISLYGDARDAETLVDVYMADLSDPRQMATACRALLTAYDIQSVSSSQTAQHHLVQRVHDYAITRSQGGSLTLAILCSHQPGDYVSPWTAPMLTQLLMATGALNESLGLGFAQIDMESSVKVVAHPSPQTVRIGGLMTATPAPISIRLMLPALAHTTYLRHPAGTEFSPYQWVNRLSANQAQWNSPARITGLDSSLLLARATLALEALAQVNAVAANPGQPADTFEFSISDYVYKSQFATKHVPAMQAQKRGVDDDSESGSRNRPALSSA